MNSQLSIHTLFCLNFIEVTSKIITARDKKKTRKKSGRPWGKTKIEGLWTYFKTKISPQTLPLRGRFRAPCSANVLRARSRQPGKGCWFTYKGVACNFFRTLSSSVSKWNLLVLVDPSLLHHTFLLGPARFTALRISALLSCSMLARVLRTRYLCGQTTLERHYGGKRVSQG